MAALPSSSRVLGSHSTTQGREVSSPAGTTTVQEDLPDPSSPSKFFLEEEKTWRRWEHEVEHFRVFSRPRSVSVLLLLLLAVFLFSCRVSPTARDPLEGIFILDGEYQSYNYDDEHDEYYHAASGIRQKLVDSVCQSMDGKMFPPRSEVASSSTLASKSNFGFWEGAEKAESAAASDSGTKGKKQLLLTVGDPSDSLWNGYRAAAVVLLTTAAVSFPDGPFVRPHPLFWRLVLGVSLLYWLTLIFVLCAEYDQVRAVLAWLYPDELSPERWNPSQLPWVTVSFLDSPEYAADCTLTWENVESKFDVFVICHFLGWAAKGLMVRNYTLCWIMSVFWEITELFFAYILPNFSECWWDSWVADVLVCNGLGICFGIELCRFLEVPNYEWHYRSPDDAEKKKLKTRVKRKIYLMLSPKVATRTSANGSGSTSATGAGDGGGAEQNLRGGGAVVAPLDKIRWEPLETKKRYCVCILMVFVNQLVELNAFVLKNIFEIPSPHKLNILRLLFWALLCLPACRQVYLFAIDESVGRLGTYAWFGLGTAVTEFLVGLKFGFLMTRPKAPWPMGKTLYVTCCWLLTLAAFTTVWLYISRVLESCHRGRIERRRAAGGIKGVLERKKTD